MKRMLRVLFAFVARDATMAASYRLEFVLHLASVVFYITALYFLSTIIGKNEALDPYGGYLPFAAIGMAVASYFQVGFDSFSKAIHREQIQGTLEALLMAPVRLPLLVLASSAWRFSWTMLVSLVYVIAAVVLYDVEIRGSVLLALAILALTTVVFASLGVLSAAFLMVWKRGDPVGLVMGGLMTLFGGVFYPVSAMPGWLQQISYLLPITYGLDGIRGVLLRGVGFAEVWPQIAVLLGFAAVVTPLAMWAFGAAVRRAQRDGTLLHF